jgi:hypothetical protein
MNKAQRIILVIYFILLAYCCIWIPWRVMVGASPRQFTHVVYCLIWAVPNIGYVPGFNAVLEKNVILLRIVALTGTSAATSEFSGLLRRSATRS